jgi:hypothetical protein
LLLRLVMASAPDKWKKLECYSRENYCKEEERIRLDSPVVASGGKGARDMPSAPYSSCLRLSAHTRAWMSQLAPTAPWHRSAHILAALWLADAYILFSLAMTKDKKFQEYRRTAAEDGHDGMRCVGAAA